MADLDETAIAQLAREMVMCIRPHTRIFADFGIDENDYYEIIKTDYYKRVKDHYTLQWNSALSAADRVKLISASYAEQALPIMGKRMIDPKEPMGVALDTFKQFCKNAGIGDARAPEAAASDKFVITINLGADTKGQPVIEHYEQPVAIDLNPVRPEK